MDDLKGIWALPAQDTPGTKTLLQVGTVRHIKFGTYYDHAVENSRDFQIFVTLNLLGRNRGRPF